MTRNVSRAAGYATLLVASMVVSRWWFAAADVATAALFVLGALVAEVVVPALFPHPEAATAPCALAALARPDRPRWRPVALVLVAALLVCCGVSLVSHAMSCRAGACDVRR
jgi:hypothetical protein